MGASHPLGVSLYELFGRIFKHTRTVGAGDISARRSLRWPRLDPNTLGNRGTRHLAWVLDKCGSLLEWFDCEPSKSTPIVWIVDRQPSAPRFVQLDSREYL